MWKATDIYTCAILILTCEIIHSYIYSTWEITDMLVTTPGDQRLSREQNTSSLWLKGTLLVNYSKMDYKPSVSNHEEIQLPMHSAESREG